MRQRLTPHFVFSGSNQTAAVLAVKENYISWEALRLSWGASGATDSHLWQELEQEAMLFVYRFPQRDLDIWMR